MRSEIKSLLCNVMALATGLALGGCNEPNGPQVSNANVATAVTSSTVQASAGTPMVSAYSAGQKSVPLTSCNLERFDGVTFGAELIELPISQTHSFSGWIAAPRLEKAAYWLRFEDKQAKRYFQTHVDPSIERPDVVGIAGNEGFPPRSGFKVDFAANTLVAGQYHVYLAATVGDKTYSCDNGRQVSIGN